MPEGQQGAAIQEADPVLAQEEEPCDPGPKPAQAPYYHFLPTPTPVFAITPFLLQVCPAFLPPWPWPCQVPPGLCSICIPMAHLPFPLRLHHPPSPLSLREVYEEVKVTSSDSGDN